MIKVHHQGCRNLEKAERGRLISLQWEDIIERDEFRPGNDYSELEANDFRILLHHRDLGVDYSLKTASVIHLPKQEVFDRHRKLRDMGLLKRVEPVMIQYRKGVVDNKWIKHRNHTYYELTPRGYDYLSYFLNQEKR
jgi:predicted transcriptional regulator